jgi:hypothetical protein
MGLRPRFKTPFSQARDKLIAYASRPLLVFKPGTRFLIGCGVLVLLTTLLLVTNRFSGVSGNYQLGEVLNRSVIAPADITAVDSVETEKRKAAARESTRAVFNFDSSRAETSVQSFRSAWEDLKDQTSQNRPAVWNGEGGQAVRRCESVATGDRARRRSQPGLPDYRAGAANENGATLISSPESRAENRQSSRMVV